MLLVVEETAGRNGKGEHDVGARACLWLFVLYFFTR